MKKILSVGSILILALGVLVSFAPQVFAATITTAGSGNWNSTTPNAPWPGGTVPLATDDVIIRPNDNITVTAAATINSITFNATANTLRTLTVNSGITLTVTAGITVQNAAANGTNAAIAGAGTITCASVTVGGNITNLSSDEDTILTPTISTLSISGNLSLMGVDDGNDDNNGVFNLNSGLVSVGGTVILNAESGSSATVTLASGAQTGTLTLSGATPFSTPGAGTATFTAKGTGATVVYSGATQTVRNVTYTNLTLSGSGAKTTTGVTVNGILSMEGTATASVAPTYGTNATLQYNTATGRTAGAEWITPFAATGGVIIANTGTITANGAKVFNANVPLTINSGATLAMAANLLTLNGNLINNSTMTGSGGVTIAGTATQSIGGFTNTGTVSMTKTGGSTATFTGNVNGGALTINGSGGTLNLGTGLTHTFTGTWTRTNGTLNGGSSTLKLGAGFSGTGGTFTAGTGTVEWNAAGVQTMADVTYYNLTTSGSDTKTPNAAYTVNNTLTVGSGTTLDESTRTLTLPGGATLVVNGTLDFTDTAGLIQSGTSGTTTLTMGANGVIRTLDSAGLGPASGASLQTQLGGAWTTTSISTNGTVEYYRNATSGQTVTDRDYNNLTITGSTQTKTWTLAATRTVNGNVTINSGAPFTLSGAQTMNIKGNWSNSGTFTPGTGTINFNGATQTINNANTWYNLSITGTTVRTVTLQSGVAQTVTNGLTLTGASGQLLTLAPSASPTKWQLNAPATQNISYVSSSYSDASSGTLINAFGGTGNVDGGNNTNWNFSAPNAPSSINQYKTDGTTVITQGTGSTNQTQVVFKATATDPDGNQYKLEVEVLPNASSYTGSATCTSSLVNSGSEASTGACGTFTNGVSYKWQYRLTDSAGASTAWTAFGGTDPDFTMDTTAPTLTVNSQVTNNTIPTISGTTNDNSANVSVTINGTDYTRTYDSIGPSLGNWSIVSLDALANGSYTISASSTDAAGNTGTAGGSLVIDPNALNLTVNPIPHNNTGNADISGTVDAGSAVAVTISGTSYPATVTGSSWSVSVSGLAEGSYAVLVAATNETNSASQTTTLIIDKTPPVVTGLTDDATSSKSKTWNWDSDDETATYRFAIDQGSEWIPTGEYSDIKTTTQPSGNGTYYLHVEAKDTVGNESPITTVSAVLDNTAPTVTKLGDNSADVTLSTGDISLVFSEILSDSSKTAVQNALTAGADKALSYAWSGATLTITATETTTFANDVVVSVSDVAGNTTTLLIVDSKLADTQTTPDSSTGVATADSTTPEVVITDPNQSVTVTISSGTTNPTIDVSSFITGGTGTLPAITITSANANNTNVAIPDSTTVTSADATWDGVIAAPTVTTVTLPETSGQTKTLSTAIEVGFTGAKLSFDKAVRILLPGQAGKRAGYVRTGIDFTEITSTCAADNQATGDALAVDGDCKIDVGSDLVIWTKHFTTFATYTQTTNSTGGGGGGGGGYYAPTTPITDTGFVVAMPGQGGITTLTNPDGSKIKLTVPAGAISGNTVFTIEKVDIDLIDQPSPGSGLFLINGLVYEIKARDGNKSITTFDKSLTLSFTYIDEQIKGLNENSLKIYRWNEEEWVALENSEVNIDNNTVTVSIDHFTLFALIGSKIGLIEEEKEKEEEIPAEEIPAEEVVLAPTGEEEVEKPPEEGIEGEEEIAGPEEVEKPILAEERPLGEIFATEGLLAAVIAAPFSLKIILLGAGVIIVGLLILWLIRRKKIKSV